MKFHWGVGLVVAFIVFAIGIVVMVTISMNQKIDLVADNYYQQELKHQQQIDRTTRAAALKEQVQVKTLRASVMVRFPPTMERTKLGGELNFYRPADRSKDFVVPVAVDSTNTQTVLTSSLERGLWRLKMRWKYGEVEYYNEEVVVME